MKGMTHVLAAGAMILALALTSLTAKAEEEMSPAAKPVLNINTATVEELENLKGVGTAKAKAIVAYREQFGEFESVEELMEVKGIGEATLKENLQLISLE